MWKEKGKIDELEFNGYNIQNIKGLWRQTCIDATESQLNRMEKVERRSVHPRYDGRWKTSVLKKREWRPRSVIIKIKYLQISNDIYLVTPIFFITKMFTINLFENKN